MATFGFKLETSRLTLKGEAQLKIALMHRSQVACVSLGIRLLPAQWDAGRERIVGHPYAAQYNVAARLKRTRLEEQLVLMEMNERDALLRMNAAQLKNELVERAGMAEEHRPRSRELLLPHLEAHAARARAKNTTSIYLSTRAHILGFVGEERAARLTFADVDRRWLEDFDRYLSASSPARNARNIHLRNLRAVFNRAIDDGDTQCYPFRKFKIKAEETAKRSLPYEGISRLMGMEVEDFLQRYVDAFRLMFLLCGINIGDLCAARTLTDGRLVYRRAKTGRLYSVKVEPEARALLQRYRGAEHLVSFGEGAGGYETFYRNANRALKLVSADAQCAGPGLPKSRTPLFPEISTYWARHTWATMAAELDVPKETIAAALGHGTRTVTDVYIRFDQRKVDEANRRVIDWVLYGKR